MKFLKNIVTRWVRDDWNTVGTVKASPSRSIDEIRDPELSFKVYCATGGYIMDFRRYNRKNDSYDGQLYVITKEEDIGERVARIVNLEMLK